MNVVSMKSELPARLTDDGSSLVKAAYIFTSLSNTIRLAVLVRVIEREWSVNELASELQISQSALSQHLGKLRQARIVQARRDRQSIFYRCDNEMVLRLLVESGVLRQ
jgi:ArsR family transcriptional regulator, virulence genes transcriptional regulator